MNDEQLLNWVADRLVHQHGDNECTDHIRRLRKLALAAREPVIPAPSGFEASWKEGETVPAGTRVRYVGDNGEQHGCGEPVKIGDLGTVVKTATGFVLVRWDIPRGMYHGGAGICPSGHGWYVVVHFLQIVHSTEEPS